MITDAPLGLFLGIIAYLVAAAVWLHKVTSTGGQTKAVLVGACLWLGVSAVVPIVLVSTSAPASAQFFVFTPFLLCCIWVGASGYGMRIAQAPLWALTVVHVFRVPLEIVLDIWAHAGVVPVQMTYRGDNFDIATGVFAALLGVAFWVGKVPRWLCVVFNLFGLAMLVNILVIVNRSSPTVLRRLLGGYETGPEMLPAFSFPAVWIATVALMPALALHIAVLRRLRADRFDQPKG